MKPPNEGTGLTGKAFRKVIPGVFLEIEELKGKDRKLGCDGGM